MRRWIQAGCWLVAFWGLFVIAMGCGGSSTGTRTPDDGRVFVENAAYDPSDPSFLVVSFLNEHMELVETTVEGKDPKEVSGGVLTGGKKYTFKVVAHKRLFNPSAEVALMIDGSMTIRVLKIPVEGSYGSPQIDYEIRGGGG